MLIRFVRRNIGFFRDFSGFIAGVSALACGIVNDFGPHNLKSFTITIELMLICFLGMTICYLSHDVIKRLKELE